MNRDRVILPCPHYFLSHSVGAQPADFEAAYAANFADPWRSRSGAAWNVWLQTIEKFKSGLAPLIGASADDICPQTNISSGLTKIISALPERARRTKIVLTEDDFPTIGFVLEKARRHGYELVFLPGGERLTDPDAWSPAFRDDVQLVLATHAFSNSSVVSPVAEIVARARARGVFSVLDIAQSAGSVPIDLNAWGPDFALGTSLKYLCGGPGAAFLWASPEAAARSAPADVGWFSHENPFEFDIRHFEYATGAARFMGGTPSIAPFAGALAGLALIADMGIDAIHAHTRTLLAQLDERLPEGVALSCRQEAARGAGFLIRVRNISAALADLESAGVGCDERRGAVRGSVHFYNDNADIDALVAAIEPHL